MKMVELPAETCRWKYHNEYIPAELNVFIGSWYTSKIFNYLVLSLTSCEFVRSYEWYRGLWCVCVYPTLRL